MNSLKQKALKGVVWTFAQQFSVQIINLIVQISLARVLEPEMFGLIAMITVFTAIGYTLMDGGMTSSLIRSKNPDQVDYSTVFLTNIAVGVFIYIVVYFIAPWVAVFYDKYILKAILRVFSLSFVIRALAAVHMTKLTKEMNFKAQLKMEIPASLIGGAVGLAMAYLGFGVWSLVGLNLTNVFVITICCWFFMKWKPSLILNKEKLKYHFDFGYKMTLSGLLDTVYRNIYNIFIGKYFLSTTVGYFNQADTMRSFPVNQISAAMGKVTYPLFAEIRNDSDLKNTYKKTMKMVFFIVVPMMLSLIVSARELFVILFGEKWLPSVPYFQVLAIASAAAPLSTYNLNILKVKGRSDLFLKLEVAKKSIGFVVVIVMVNFGIIPLVISYVLVSYLFTFMNMIISGKLIQYTFFEQCKDCGMIFIIGLFSLVISYYVREKLGIYEQMPLISFLMVSLFYFIIYLPFIYWRDRELVLSMANLIKK